MNKEYGVNEDSSKEGSSKEGSSKNRLTRANLIELIKSTCITEYLSLEEIASKVEKDSKYLRDKVFPKMIKEGELIKLHPDNHPNQKYKSAN